MEIKKLVLGRIDNNTYIVSKGKDCFVIDPSMEYNQIIGYIKENGLNVVAILITHAHYDHVFSLYELVQDTGAPVYMHGDDLNAYGMAVRRINSEPVEIENFIKDGDVLEILGEKIEVMHFPGHAKGLVAFMMDDTMFCGDFLFKGTTGRTDLPGSNTAQMKESLIKFSKLTRGNFKILSGHGEDTTFDEEMANNPFLMDLR